MHGAGPPCCLDEIPLQLDLPDVVVGDEERASHTFKGLPEGLRPGEVAHDRLHGGAGERGALVFTPDQGPNRHSLRGELADHRAADEPGGSGDEDHPGGRSALVVTP